MLYFYISFLEYYLNSKSKVKLFCKPKSFKHGLNTAILILKFAIERYCPTKYYIQKTNPHLASFFNLVRPKDVFCTFITVPPLKLSIMTNKSKQLEDTTHTVLKKLSDYLKESQAGQIKTLQQMPAHKLAKMLQLEYWIKNGGLNASNMGDFLDPYLENSQHLHHPNYLGHQVAVPHIASSMADFIHGVINNPMAIYEMGPAAATIERTVINWMLQKIGWFKGDSLSDFSWIERNGGGVLTNGGSAANLTAMLAARAYIAPQAWEEGTPQDLVVLGSEVAHYSIARAISILGLGKKAMLAVPVNKLEVLRPETLMASYQQAKNEGKRVMAVVANACATSTGLYDPLDEIGHLCEEHGLWFHIDGAHGATALLSENEKHLMKGVSRANSMIWDMHKMMQTSALCAAVLFKDFRSLEGTFQQKGSYLFHEKETFGFDSLPYAVECTKSELGNKLFMVLAAEGEQGMADFVEGLYKKTKGFYQMLNGHPDFYCPYVPESNILCFQYTKHGTDNAFQLALRNEIVKRGNFYITSTEVSGVRYLRLSVMNPLTQEKHIGRLMEEIRHVASQKMAF